MSEATTTDIVLALLRNHGDEVRGKTVLQKLAYFCSVMLKDDMGYSPHYFGPYSRQVESAVDRLTLSGVLMENSSVIGSSQSGMPIRHYSYLLSDKGRETADQLRGQMKWLDHVAKFVCEKVGEHGDDLSAKPLSLAAKVHFVLENKKRPMTPEQIRAASKELGWDVNEWQIDRAIELLKRLKLATTGTKEEKGVPSEAF